MNRGLPFQRWPTRLNARFCLAHTSACTEHGLCRRSRFRAVVCDDPAGLSTCVLPRVLHTWAHVARKLLRESSERVLCFSVKVLMFRLDFYLGAIWHSQGLRWSFRTRHAFPALKRAPDKRCRAGRNIKGFRVRLSFTWHLIIYSDTHSKRINVYATTLFFLPYFIYQSCSTSKWKTYIFCRTDNGPNLGSPKSYSHENFFTIKYLMLLAKNFNTRCINEYFERSGEQYLLWTTFLWKTGLVIFHANRHQNAGRNYCRIPTTICYDPTFPAIPFLAWRKSISSDSGRGRSDMCCCNDSQKSARRE